MPDEQNNIFNIAADLVENTSLSLFLTGKAGTGKTTFLRHIKETTKKTAMVSAPTGIAAINAGGVTLHSLFQLPFEPFTPDNEGIGERKLTYHFRMHKNKIEMFRQLELLIIDEVSMLRADILDAIDVALKHLRRNKLPFGGVQMLYIGDLYQLPPVVQDEEWEILSRYYKSPFFFHAKSIIQSPPLNIELKKIYRQSEQSFINILNHVRNNEMTNEDLQTLNARYIPDFVPPEDKKYIVLATHNYKADNINAKELSRLPGNEKIYSGEIKGDFSLSALPTENELKLKVGAQIMFVKNDTGENRRFYNGKLGTILYLYDDKIIIRPNDSGPDIDLVRETWRNIRYTLDKESGLIKEDELGAFTQFPIRLAWAVTIHKSQGLTFERAIIDAEKAFAAGQVYVALSRCTSLEGIVLHSQITPGCVKTDPQIVEFSRYEKEIPELERILDIERPKYWSMKLLQAFEWRPLIELCKSFAELVSEKTLPDQQAALKLALDIKNKAYDQRAIAGKFQNQLEQLLQQVMQTGDVDKLKDRVGKAVVYFHKEIYENIALPLDEHIESLKRASKVKLYLKDARSIRLRIGEFMSRLRGLSFGDMKLTGGIVFEVVPTTEKPVEESVPSDKYSEKKPRPEKGSSHRLSLEMFIDEGKTIEEIAIERNLAGSTIENHLVSFIRTGEISVDVLVSEEKLKILLPLVENLPEICSLSEIKQQLSDDFSYGDIRAALNHSLRLRDNA